MKKKILITGATKGVGLALSHYLVERNWDVIGLARHTPASFPGIFYAIDLANINSSDTMLKHIASQYRIDAIVNNLGISSYQKLEDIDLTELSSVYDLNVRCAVQVSQAFVATMKKQAWGRIVNILSRAMFGIPGKTSYAAAKNALLGCARTWALELAKFNITVNAVSPGPIDTPDFHHRNPKNSATRQKIFTEIPMQRLAKLNEISAAVYYFLQEESAFVTGQVLNVDGGVSL